MTEKSSLQNSRSPDDLCWYDTLPTAAVAIVFCAGLYGVCNHVTAMRPHVATLQAAWERDIPFVPWMIVPYMLMNGMVAASFLACRRRAELFGHARRLIAANIVAATCFLLFPLRMMVERPRVIPGMWAPVYRLLYTLDAPYNLAPSLHIAEGILVWTIFARHVPPRLRPLLHLFMLTGFASTLLTWQHGAIDLITGLLLGVLCLRIFPDPEAAGSRGRMRDGGDGLRGALVATD